MPAPILEYPVKNHFAIYSRRVEDDSSLGSPAVSDLSSDGLPGGQDTAVLNGVQPDDRALRQMSADAILVTIMVAAGAHHRQGAAVVPRPLAMQQLVHTLAKVA